MQTGCEPSTPRSAQPTPAAPATPPLPGASWGNRALRVKVAACALLAVVVFAASLCIRVNTYGLMEPAAVARTLAGAFRIDVLGAFDGSIALQRNQLIAELPLYYEVTRRLGVSVVTLLAGALLALAGMLYQNVFRNPIAAPTMLGVTSGVNLGVVVLVLQFGSLAVGMSAQRYLYCFAGGLLVLALVFLLTVLVCGRRQLNVINLLLVGSMISTAVNAVANYFVDLWSGTDLYDTYYLITQSLAVQTDGYAFASLLGACLVGVIPLFLLRFSLNLMVFADDDTRMSGVRPQALRVLALAVGTLMILAAQIHTGLIALISLLVPFLVRRAFGGTFAQQLAGNLALGPLVLLLCRGITDLVPFVGEGLPLTATVALVTLPLFVWAMAVTQRDWT